MCIIDDIKMQLQVSQATSLVWKIFELEHNAVLSTPTGEFAQLLAKVYTNVDRMLPGLHGPNPNPTQTLIVSLTLTLTPVARFVRSSIPDGTGDICCGDFDWEFVWMDCGPTTCVVCCLY